MFFTRSVWTVRKKNREFTRVDHCSPRKSSRICAPWQINKQTTQTGMMIFIQTRWKEWTFWDLSSVSHCIDPKSKCCYFTCQCMFACYSIWKRRIVHVRSDTLGYTCKHLDVHNKKLREHPVFFMVPNLTRNIQFHLNSYTVFIWGCLQYVISTHSRASFVPCRCGSRELGD